MAARPDSGWPVYFSRVDMAHAGKFNLKAGDVFPIQSKDTIRGLGGAYDVDGWALRFSELPYVETLDVQTEQVASQILEGGFGFEEAKRLIAGETRPRRGRPPKAA